MPLLSPYFLDVHDHNLSIADKMTANKMFANKIIIDEMKVEEMTRCLITGRH
jgi:hypothetical protein